jgi:hypothetical protein
MWQRTKVCSHPGRYGFFPLYSSNHVRLFNEDISRIAIEEVEPDASVLPRLREAFNRIRNCTEVGPSERLPLTASAANYLRQLSVAVDSDIDLKPDNLGSAFWITGPFNCGPDAFFVDSMVEAIIHRMSGFSTQFCRLSQHVHTFWAPKYANTTSIQRIMISYPHAESNWPRSWRMGNTSTRL